MNDLLRGALGKALGRRPPALQVAALCVSAETGKVLLITSRGTKRWIIPKGWPMTGRSAAGAALQEAWEEAGVRGKVDEVAFGEYSYLKRLPGGISQPVIAQVHMVRVTSLVRDYPEHRQRQRKWFSAAKAAELVDEDGLKALIGRLEGEAKPGKKG
ncbi:NUDIX hydrolase [Paracoccus aurantiacus]|uniref:NUDIX hydrolase n=2 Tax=Paracoccus aurantiacus TaxID=2599412 RepID=A0A5C6S173_9RHOB|nr:NUDIX hydrolase [Paracoccus aurantiacus]